jgi:peptidoglycan/LPS O-acetylase OafA/YrhL
VPEPVGRSQRYMPGLDGLRALAVLAVIAYHLGLGWAPGGLLGVGVFFTLSGYLITDLLLAEKAHGRVQLGDFWLRRARRLLPGLFVMLIVVSAWVTIAHRSQLADLRGQVGAATLYVSNWWQIFQHVPYFARFGQPSPLNHLWSLAVEEQFYLLWPWLLLAGVYLIRERRRRIAIRPRLAAVTLALAIVSAVEMAVLYHPTFDPSRVYDATDTRAFGLLFGAALAMVWPSRLLTTRLRPQARTILDLAGVVGLVTIGLLVWRTNQYSPFLYRGGIVLLSVATVLVVATVAHPATRVGLALGWAPLRWIGVRSYGIYLWHAPVIVLTSPANATPEFARSALQVGASIGLAALSWQFIEEPVRHGAIRRLWAQARAVGWRPRALPRRVQAGLAAAAIALAFACAGLAGVGPGRQKGPTLAGIQVDAGDIGSSLSASKLRAAVTSTTTVNPPTTTVPATRIARASPRSSCTSVVHIGDSTSDGLISRDYLPNPRERIDAQYARVGAVHQHLQITGATSIVETLPGGTNAYEVAKALVAHGYRGCWVIALGTNDTADIYVGSNVGLSERVKRMMSVIRDQPVMWLTVKSLVSSGPYSESDMEKWNAAIVHACSRYPNMRLFDWASVVHDNWFITDGIHFTSAGYAARAKLIANALAEAFPHDAASIGASVGNGCMVHG